MDWVALVLGAGGSLGRAIAMSLAQVGGKRALADIDEEALEETKQALVAARAEAMVLRWDLANLTAIESELGAVDVLVNNTGGPPPNTALGQKPDLWSKFFGSMVLSVIALTDRVVLWRFAKWFFKL